MYSIYILFFRLSITNDSTNVKNEHKLNASTFLHFLTYSFQIIVHDHNIDFLNVSDLHDRDYINIS